MPRSVQPGDPTQAKPPRADKPEGRAKSGPEGARPLARHALEALVDNPDLFYSQHDVPAELTAVAQAPGRLAGLLPVQRLRLAAVYPPARQALVGRKPPKMDPSSQGGDQGAALPTVENIRAPEREQGGAR